MGKLVGCGLILSGLLIGGVGVPLSAGSSSFTQASPGDLQTVAVRRLTVEKGDAEPAPRGPVLRPLPVAATEAPRPVPVPQPAVRPVVSSSSERKPLVTSFETATVANEPAAITRALQVELARVGCYDGGPTGVWSQSTRRAMKAFTDRVNAALPVDKPDFILLSLVQAQTGKVCGSGCPTGQAAGPQGQCTPHAILAQAARKVKGHRQYAAKSDAANAVEGKGQSADVATPPPIQPPQAPAAQPPAPAMAPSISDTPRMALAGPREPEPSSHRTTAPEKHGREKRIVKREHRDAPTAKVSYGQTRWARDFFRNASTF